jgi:hypothetical protein
MRTPEAFARLGGPQEPDALRGIWSLRRSSTGETVRSPRRCARRRSWGTGSGCGVSSADLVVADINTTNALSDQPKTPRGLGGSRFGGLLPHLRAAEPSAVGGLRSPEDFQRGSKRTKAGHRSARVAPDGWRRFEHAEALAIRIRGKSAVETCRLSCACERLAHGFKPNPHGADRQPFTDPNGNSI